ncbi:hypothetical protein L1049_002817 [Liquidambar formosana]|uniref:SBP-type domain-containing protein n=1 Tax=Liquidambar formosana TaxID=63359 RepID=A0AAP0R8G6_LIQFO
MDRNLKASAWDLTELNQQNNTLFASLVESSSLGGNKKIGEFSVDLKLGRLGDLGDRSVGKLKNLKASTMVSSPSGSSKRIRTLNGTQNVSCSVDGCTSDLSRCREYHRRHRVCERHSKTPVVIIRGEERRFCQQCSRFHSLGEFDEVKRSCRKRLDGHNRRRRKPQPESLYVNSESFLSNYQGTGFLQFSSPQVDATTTARSLAWPMVAKTEDRAMLYQRHQQLHLLERQSPPSSSFSGIYNGEDEHFLQANDLKLDKNATHEVSVCQPLLHTIASSESYQSRHRTLSDGLTQSVDSDCSHSLLSTHPTQTSGFDLSHLLQPNVTLPVEPLGLGLHFDGLAQYTCSHGVGSEPVDLVPHASNTHVHCNELFPAPPDGLWKMGPHKSFQFLGSR